MEPERQLRSLQLRPALPALHPLEFLVIVMERIQNGFGTDGWSGSEGGLVEQSEKLRARSGFVLLGTRLQIVTSLVDRFDQRVTRHQEKLALGFAHVVL